MIRIFQTGDNHIGLRYASHEKASELAAVRTQAFHAMVERANEERCDIFAITGDLFENTYGVSKKEVNSLVTILAEFSGIVAVIPGNHDYYDKDTKVWQYFISAAQDKHNFLLMTEYKPYDVPVRGETVRLYPAFCRTLHSVQGENNLGWMKGLDVDRNVYNIGMAHGAVEGETIDSEGRYFMMTRSELSDIPMDVWLIGHTHVPFPRNLTEEYSGVCDRIFNAGTHVQTDVSCNTEGLCFIIELSEDKTIRAKTFKSGTIHFKRLSVDLTAKHMPDALKDALSPLDDSTVVDLILTGATRDEYYENRAEIIENELSRFIEGTYTDYGVSRLLTEELIDAQFAQTSFISGFLKALLTEPKEAQMVYDMIGRMKGNNGRS